MASAIHGLRAAAPQLLSRDLFVCRQCLGKARPTMTLTTAPLIPRPFPSTAESPRRFQAQAVRFKASIADGLPKMADVAPRAASGSPLGALSHQLAQQPPPRARSRPETPRFPETSSKGVAYWLLGSAASVFGLVVFGGLTRLTESGLSITEWKPITGSIYPRSVAAWQCEFDKYRASPEFLLLNSHMTLGEFQRIYLMEWTHRQWGRLVGLSFVLPAAWLVARRRVSARTARRVLAIAVLIGVQGGIGWWMVASGLRDDLFAPGSHPRVSQYRLAAHLGTAFVCYLAMLYSGLAVLRKHRLLRMLATPAPAAAAAAAAATAAAASSSPPPADLARLLRGRVAALRPPRLAPFRRYVALLGALVFLTAMSGALVAGLDAGLVYNEFPRMGRGLVPPRAELLDAFYSRRPDDRADLVWRNMLENPVTAQLDHRVLATTTVVAVLALAAYARLAPGLWRGAGGGGAALLPRGARRAVVGLVGLVSMQAMLGIGTLVYLVPVPLAAAHQAGALLLLSGVAVLGSRVWIPARTVRMLQSRLARAEALQARAGAGVNGATGAHRQIAAGAAKRVA